MTSPGRPAPLHRPAAEIDGGRAWNGRVGAPLRRVGHARDTAVATVRVPAEGSGRRRRAQHTQTFATTTAGITALADWLAEQRVTRTEMESTGVYWKPVYYPTSETSSRCG